MSDAQRRPARPLPDLSDIPVEGRRAVVALIQCNRRALQRRNATARGDEWTAGLLEGLYAAGGLRSRGEMKRVAKLVADDLLAVAMTRLGPPSRSRDQGHRVHLG